MKNDDEENYFLKLNKDELNDVDILKTFNVVEKPFLQIEYTIDETENNSSEKIEIHNKLHPFYLENNLILDKVFIYWFIKTYFDEIPSEKYNLQIIDSEISIFKIKENQSCLIKNDSYEIKQM